MPVDTNTVSMFVLITKTWVYTFSTEKWDPVGLCQWYWWYWPNNRKIVNDVKITTQLLCTTPPSPTPIIICVNGQRVSKQYEGLWWQKQVSQAWKSNGIPQYPVKYNCISLPEIPAHMIFAIPSSGEDIFRENYTYVSVKQRWQYSEWSKNYMMWKHISEFCVCVTCNYSNTQTCMYVYVPVYLMCVSFHSVLCERWKNETVKL